MFLKTSNQEQFNLGFNNFNCNWGLHIAGLYETAEERDQIIFGFLKQGILEEDLQLYCPVERSKEDFEKEFSKFCPDCHSKLNDASIFQFKTARELYYPTGEFSPLEMQNSLNLFFNDSQKNGKRNIRATAEMTWALDAIPGVEKLMIYESQLNYFINGKPWVSICLYNVTQFSGEMIMKVLQTHPYTINKGSLFANPFFVNPDNWLKENAPQFLAQ